MKKKKTVIILASFLVAILIICGVLVYRSIAKTAIIKQCDKYIHLYEYDILPDEYRKDKYPECIIPEDFINNKLFEIENQYYELFGETKYNDEVLKKREWFNNKIITGEVILRDYDISIKNINSFKLTNIKEAEIFIVVSQKGTDMVKDGSSYTDEPFNADVGYKITFEKIEDQWKIMKVTFIPVL